jgi:hypothetical protein
VVLWHVLTNREFELLQFLLDHPHRFYTPSQIMGYAWSDSALFPEEVRNYVSRVRKILVRLEIPCDLVNRPGRVAIPSRSAPRTSSNGIEQVAMRAGNHDHWFSPSEVHGATADDE